MPEPISAAVGLYTDRLAFLAAVRAAVADGLLVDATTPYPVHGLEDALGLKRSWIGRPVLGVVLLGFAVVMAALIANNTDVWPINVSGKPYDAWPLLVVCTLEAGLLAGAILNLTLAFHTSKLLPSALSEPISARLSDDAFAVILPATGDDLARRQDWLRAHGAGDVQAVQLNRGTAELAHA